VRTFAAGLTEAGADVSVHVVATMAPGARNGDGNAPQGVWRGIPYEYLTGSARPLPGWLRRRAAEAAAVWRMCRTIVRTARSDRRTAVILFSPNMRVMLPLRLACTAAGVPLVNERDEFPFVYQGDPSPGARLWRSFYNATAFGMFDGTIVISSLLEDFARKRIRSGTWIVRVPILVDADAFMCDAAPTPGLVGYAGNLSHAEELHELVSAVAALAPDHEDLRACVMGGGSLAETSALEQEIARLGITDRVELTGMRPPDEMPGRLCACSALALPRASGLFSSAGFPSKLGEYLATGRPVVVTATGDIAEYVRAGVDAFVVPPDDPTAFRAALERAVYDPAAEAVGRSGREVAQRMFSPTAHMRNVLDALEGSWSRA